ncbi:hypothetical protein GCM10023346_46720 [Arthrobacter gyeryongensis]|uniref:Uncharacterized protein n=1 Tax=Arthrobacter gyeryongensis TaxID=1650592 RepID=A0ABP9SS20_9MICC
MGLRRFFRRSPAGTAERVPAVVLTKPKPMQPQSPEHLAELQEALAELAQAAAGAGVTRFHACGRNGKSWEDDPIAIRALAATFRDFRAGGGTSDATQGTDV